ncbi:hypothetical protein [Streptomyces sp. NPDC046939]|uniref:hypothetical protein n=1 Tax=Streptomyces sp. NPDC046939 TaxID=3155376 RepID=UPI003405DFDC
MLNETDKDAPDRSHLRPLHSDHSVMQGQVGLTAVMGAVQRSWRLNWIEPEFAAPRCFALNRTDHRTHEERPGQFPVNALQGTLRVGRSRP